jgi:phage baseplate assembly protein W
MSQYRDLPNNPKNRNNVVEIESVYQSLNNLLSTNKGERLFNPTFGADLDNLLFEPLDELTSFTIYSNIVRVISQEEPRVDLDYSSSKVIPNFMNNSYDVILKFKLKSTISEDFNQTFEANLKRG